MLFTKVKLRKPTYTTINFRQDLNFKIIKELIKYVIIEKNKPINIFKKEIKIIDIEKHLGHLTSIK